LSQIAIVGMGCRFGGAPDLHEYWKLCVEGRHDFKQTPPDRWDHAAFFDKNRRATDRSYCPTGSWISDIRSFPALALGIPPRRVEVMDPQQRLALEIAIQAIHDGGYQPEDLPRRTGVFMGVTATEYRLLAATRIVAAMMAGGQLGESPADASDIAESVRHVMPSRPFSAPGALANMIAAAVAQELDLHGPAYTTDAACASALMATNDAVTQLRTGAIDAAVAGGVYVCLTPEHHIAFSRIGAISAAGVCRPFDENADGFVQGDGVGALLLKRLDDAKRDGDRIYAVIDGISINNDGRGDGPMAPIQSGQTECIQDAWNDASSDPTYLGYMEAHGTGTSVGDGIEFAGLMAALGERAKDVCIGSSKANVGHTMSAAGIAGIIRAALSIYHRTLPPLANFEKAKADLPLADSPFRIPRRAETWHARTRVAGVSSFGFGGTNGHVVLANAEQPPRPVSLQPAELVLLSAPTEAALKQLAAHTADIISNDPHAHLSGIARSLARRPPQDWRMGVVASSVASLNEKLRAYAKDERVKGLKAGPVRAGKANVAFLFPGQGSQRLGMLEAIRDRFPIVQETLSELEAALAADLSLPLTHYLYPERRALAVNDDTAMAELTATENCQPVLLACGIALTRLLAQLGIKPTATVGHSLGEFTAAAAGGVLSPADAARFVARRGKAMASLDGDRGAMAAIMASPEDVSELLVHGVVIANVNHPRQVVVSGTSDGVGRVVEAALAAEFKAKPLVVSHAFHSHMLASLDVDELVNALDLTEPAVTVASGIADKPYASAADARNIFRRHATSPVQFVSALEQCRDEGCDLYLQVGAGGPLASFTRGSLPKDHRGVYSLASIKDEAGDVSLLEGLAQLWIAGVEMDISPIIGDGAVSNVSTTVFPREEYWVVASGPQKGLNLNGVTPRQRAPEPARTANVADAEPVGDDVDSRVLAVVAKVSAYPLAALRPEMALADDLGFDSLMVGDLATGLAEAFPGLGGIPQELLINGPTVADIIHFAKTGAGAIADDADDDAPLLTYTPIGVQAPLPQSTESAVRNIVFGGHVDTVAAQCLIDAGHTAIASDQPADQVIWFASPKQLVPPHAVLAGETEIPDTAGNLIALLDEQARMGATPSVLVVVKDGDLWGEGAAAVARCIGREWPGAVGKSLVHTAEVDLGEVLPKEINSRDLSSAVHWSSNGRFVRGFSATTLPGSFTPSSDDVALITGGTRGIGAKLGARLAQAGARVILVGRSEPTDLAAKLVSDGKATFVRADVTDGARLSKALLAADVTNITVVIHSAGVLADGPLGEVDAKRGRLAREVKAKGFLNAIRTAGSTLKVALGIGSWAGRFGNRHQAHYAAGNAAMSALSTVAPRGARVAVAEFGPWSESDMASTIPAPIKAAMRAQGVDFVSDQTGLDTIWADLCGASGPVVHGRNLPASDRHLIYRETLTTDTHPYLLDHAIEGTPIFPLAGAADLIAHASALAAPFEICGLTLFTGVAVTEAVEVEVTVQRDRAEIRFGPKKTLAYKAQIRPLQQLPEVPSAPSGGSAPSLPLAEFYNGITFHGPLLQGIETIDAVGAEYASGQIRTGSPSAWIPGSTRSAFAVDPLALDSLMQLSGYVAWIRYQRAGTPVGIGRYVQLKPWPTGTLHGSVSDYKQDGDKFSAKLVFRDTKGEVIALATDVGAELRKVETADGEIDLSQLKPEWTDFSLLPEYVDLAMRLQMVEATGIRNPYFAVHEGTARDTTQVGENELINFSSYNYIGLSGDERVLADAKAAVDKFGTSVSASRVASGERPFHGELEALLAECQGCEDALVFTAGHATNVTTIGHLLGNDDLVLHDELIHDSILQGIKLSGASRRSFKHDDPKHLEKQLKELRTNFQKVLIVVEGVYSMDGDICDLPAYVTLKKKYGCLLMVDEAHSFGVIGKGGKGASEHFGFPGSDVDLWMGTLSKSLASCGGWIAGSTALITYLRYTAPGFVYSAGITPANAQAALSSLKLMLEEPERVLQLQDNAQFFHNELVKRRLNTGPAKGGSAVIPVVTGNSMHALMLSQRLVDQGINVQPIVYPAVADDAARLRFFLSSTHSHKQLEHTAKLVADTLTGVQVEFKL
jgi:8-amino-7-oxononanoate synthase